MLATAMHWGGAQGGHNLAGVHTTHTVHTYNTYMHLHHIHTYTTHALHTIHASHGRTVVVVGASGGDAGAHKEVDGVAWEPRRKPESGARRRVSMAWTPRCGEARGQHAEAAGRARGGRGRGLHGGRGVGGSPGTATAALQPSPRRLGLLCPREEGAATRAPWGGGGAGSRRRFRGGGSTAGGGWPAAAGAGGAQWREGIGVWRRERRSGREGAIRSGGGGVGEGG
jgi:hypothetical protein